MKTLLPLLLPGIALASQPWQPASAQVFVQSPSANLLPTFNAATSNYELQNSVTCPTPTFNMTGFGSDSNGFADGNFTTYKNASSNINNWGVTAGVSVPLGANELRKFCERFARAKTAFEESRTQNQLLNSQSDLLKHCLYLRDLGIQIKKFPALFAEGGALSSFAKCTELAGVLDPINLKPAIQLAPKAPAPASTAPPTPPPQSVFVVN